MIEACLTWSLSRAIAWKCLEGLSNYRSENKEMSFIINWDWEKCCVSWKSADIRRETNTKLTNHSRDTLTFYTDAKNKLKPFWLCIEKKDLKIKNNENWKSIEASSEVATVNVVEKKKQRDPHQSLHCLL
jgi:hypothetical protein